jgi:RHS repeat-associated protein
MLRCLAGLLAVLVVVSLSGQQPAALRGSASRSPAVTHAVKHAVPASHAKAGLAQLLAAHPGLLPGLGRPPRVRPRAVTQVASGMVTSAETGICLDDAGDSSAAGNKIDIVQCTGASAQEWAFWDDQTLRIAGGCAAVSGGATTAGSLVVLEPCVSGSAAQVWAPGRSNELVNPVSGLCLDIPGGSTTAGAQVDIAACSGSAGQQWRLPGSASGFVTNGVTGVCADDDQGTSVAVWQCDGAAAQVWQAEADSTIRTSDGLCAGLAGGALTAGTDVTLGSCTSAEDQEWAVGPNGWWWNTDARLCVTNPGGSTTNGTSLQLAACSTATQQSWRMPRVLPAAGQISSGVSGECAADSGDTEAVISVCNGTGEIWSAPGDGSIRSQNNMCMTLTGGATVSGTAVALAACTGAADQLWAFGPGGKWVVSTDTAGLCLTDPGNSTVSATQLDVEACAGAAGQTWLLPPTTVPAAPQGLAAAAGDRQAAVAWNPPWSAGGSTVTSYTVTASPGGATVTVDGSGTSAVVTGLTDGTDYTFTVTATTADGSSASSLPSSAVTPTAGTTLYAHDAAGQVTAVFDGSGAGSKISYDPDGNITSVKPLPASTLAVAQVTPPSATPGMSVRIYGTDFGSSVPGVTVTIGGATASVSSVQPNTIVAAVPSGATGTGVSVTVNGTTVSGTFSVPAPAPAPVITSLSEQVGDPGGTMTVTGSGFSTNPALDVATINDTKVAVTAATATSLTVALPPLPVGGNLTVTTPGGTATSAGQIITPAQPYMAANVGFAGELANDTATTITLSSANQIALALFPAAAGQRASFEVDANIPAGNQTNQYAINIYGPQGQMIKAVGFGDVSGNPATFTVPDDSPPGIYEAELIPVNGDTGSFQVTATTISDPTAAMTIGGPVVSVTTTTAAQNPEFTFAGNAGETVYLQDDQPGANPELFSPDGSPVSWDISDPVTLPSTGTYTLVVNLGDTGATTTTAQVNQVPVNATATATVDGGPVHLTIGAPGQGGTVTFAGTAGQQVFTKASFSSAPGNQGMSLSAPDGTVLGQAQNAGVQNLAIDTVTLPETGTYTLQISQLQGWTGTVAVTVNSAPNVTATATVDGGGLPLNIADPGQHAIVSFTGSAGEKVFTSLDMSPAMTNSGHINLLEEPAGTVLATTAFGGSAGYLNTLTLPASGTYELFLDPVDNTGGYTGTITLTLNSAPDQTGATTVDGTAASVPLPNPGEQAVVSFPGTSGQNIFTQVTLSGTVPSCSADNLTLVDTKTGSTLNTGGGLDSPPVFIGNTPLPDTTTYQVIVQPCGGYTGTVTVQVTSVPAAATASGSYGGAAVTVATTKPGQNAAISYTGVPANTAVIAKVTAATFPGGWSPSAVLKDPSGNVVGTCNALTAGTNCSSTTDATAGTYTLQVSHNGPYTGSVTVQLLAAPAALARAAVARLRWRFGWSITSSSNAQVSRVPARDTAVRVASPGPPRWSYTGSPRWSAPASLTGTILTTAGAPLPGVTVSIGSRRARTAANGKFTLTGLPQGMQVLQMNGVTASTPARSFGVFDVQVRLRAGQNQLPFTSYFPVLDTTDQVSVTEPLSRDVTLTDPAIPGLEVHLDKGSRITDASGKPVYKIGITAIPVDRTPIPMPVGEQVPVYFTVQPAGGTITDGWATVDYPNYRHARPGTPVSFWHYDLHGAGWGIYGQGTVNSSGTQVTPDPGTWVTDFNGEMIAVPGWPAPGQSWLQKVLALSADPVDPGTGLYHMTQTDLVVPDVIPLTLTRGYNPADGNSRTFGNNSFDLYDTFLSSPSPTEWTEADLNLVDGAQVHYVRTSPGIKWYDAVLTSTSTSGQFFGSKITWNGQGWNLTLRDGMTLVYGEYDLLQEIRDAHGNTVRIYRMYHNSFGSYDGPITEVVSPNGYWLSYTWDTSVNPPRITKVTDNAGQSVTYAYDASGNLHTVTDPDQQVTTYGYDSSNRLTTITDAKQITYLTNHYNSANQITSQVIAGLGTYTYNYTMASPLRGQSVYPSAGSRFLSPASPPVREQSAQVSAVTITEPDNSTRTMSFDSNGYLSSDERAAGSASAHTIGVTMDSGATPGGLPQSVSDGDGRTISSVYDSSGDELTNTYTSGTSSVSSSATYNGTPFSLPDSVTGTDGNTWHYTYNGGGDVASVTDPLGHMASALYDAQGNQTQMTGAAGDVTKYSYTDGHLTSVTDPLGRVTQYVYDQDGRLIQTVNPDGTSTSVTYDPDNQVAATTDADGNTTHYQYDQNGNLTQVTDPKNNVTKYAYNNADQLYQVTDALGNVTTYTYYPSGQLETVTDPNGAANGTETFYAYDTLNRLKTVQYGYVPATGADQSKLTYNYDPATGNVDSVTDTTTGAGSVTYAYDAFDHVKTETGPGGTITYAYDPSGQLKTMTPPGQAVISYTYDSDGHLTKETQGSQQATWAYDPDDRLTRETLPDNITADYAYNAASELTGISYWYGSDTYLGNITYAYNVDGDRIAEGGSLVHTVLPAAQPDNVYNADNELKTFNGTAFTYDNDGNLTSDGINTYGWNDRGQLTTVTTPAGTDTLGYDPLGNMISTSTGGVTTTYAYQKSQIISESSSNGTSQDFLNGPYGTLSATSTSSAGGGAVTAYLPDALQSTLALVNAAGQLQTTYSYDLFGNATSSAGTSDPNPLRYTDLISGPTMPAGLQDNNARDYAPGLGRFISQDPIGSSGSGDNLYAYTSGDPVDGSDTSGLEEAQLAACVIGAGVNDIIGALDGRKTSLGDFFAGGLGGCAQGALMTIPGAEEALAELEGSDLAEIGGNGAEDTTEIGDNLDGDGTGGDSLGEDGCSVATGNSFAGGTRVELADGASGPISSLRPGNYVRSADLATGKTIVEPVLAVIRGHKREQVARVTVTVHNGKSHVTGHIITTAGHPFYDFTRRSWVNAGSLRVGDVLYSLSGSRVIVDRVRVQSESATMYNLTVATYHDYYVGVGRAAVLVHNASCPINGYRSHALQRMAERGISEDMVEQAVATGRKVRGNMPGTYKYIGRRIWAVLNREGIIISVGWN